jgi:Holliday junction resolvasome RuvABC endonuclease subunit
MSIIRVAAIDPSLSNFGMVKLNLNLTTMTFEVLEFKLIETERQVTKQVRQNSDDLRRARQIYKAFHAFVIDCILVFAEIPSGAQSARAALSFGVSVGIVASCPKPALQIQPTESKMAAVGTKTASKEEIISWASELYPDAPWMRTAKGKILNKNEHLADSIAIAHAGIATDQFLQLLAMRKAA